jgi:hypothetical protein
MGRLCVALIAIGILAQTTNAGILDGRWRHGSWTDDNTGHEGPLRARFREDQNGNYRVVFSGRFAKIVPFRFATTLNVVGRDGDKVIMSGTSRIFGFGSFSYDAVADRNNFSSRYFSRRWTGTFKLSR